mmetsp:Transcript_11878/g.18226  ORF Transcript_11878/g.18226 Transcript_11878/m.18226 type:complete len:384 (-) Transcript_11878:225-1376(-)
MKMTKYSAALAALYAQDPQSLDRSFQHLTPPALSDLDSKLAAADDSSSDGSSKLLAKAVIRRMVHNCLDKFSSLSSLETIEEALNYHELPKKLQLELEQRYGHRSRTWLEALQQLQKQSSNKSDLWEMVLDHPMTAYVPMQCQFCGHIVPDNTIEKDEEVGLSEEEPSGDELELRSGWFRGPRRAVIFVLDCPKCQSCSRWYRSGHPQVMLNPHRWGRLCGEQEDLRLNLAKYLEIPLRLCLPLDWDHIWSEFRDNDDDSEWQVSDPNAKNFAARLDEGIGSWTGVWAIHPDPNLCEDVTDTYLRCQQDGGHLDDSFQNNMERYRKMVQSSRQQLVDNHSTSTQAKSVNGYVLHRANFTTSSEITKEIRKAAADYGIHPWWEI